jgi:hypothetical protein
MVRSTKNLDEIANKYNKTKDIKYKDLWYKLIKDNYGTNNSKRRIVSINSCIKNDNGTYTFIGTSELYGNVRNTKTKTNRLRRHTKLTHYE